MSYKYFGRLVGNVSTGTQSLTETTPADTTTPFNPQQPATKFMAYGEDATSLAFNRALSALSGNIDSLSSVLNSVTTKAAVISPLQSYADSNAAAADYAGEGSWRRGAIALGDNPDAKDASLLTTGAVSINLSDPDGIAPVNWVYVGLNATELPLNVTFHRVLGQNTGYANTAGLADVGQIDLTKITNPDDVDGLQTIYDTFHSVTPSDVYENSSEYNSGGGYSYHQPKYKNGAQAYLTDNPDTGLPLYVPPVKRVKTDLAPYNGNERYSRISGWDSDGLYMRDYSADELFLRPGCYVEVVGDGSEGAQAGNNGLYQIAEIIPADETAPTAAGAKLVLTRGGFHKVTVRDYTQFMEGELVSWRTSPYHQDSGDPTDPESSALNPSLRANFAHIGFIVPRPDLNSDAKPEEHPGDLYLRASVEASRFTSKTEGGLTDTYDWSRGVPSTLVGGTRRYGGQRSYGNVGLPDKEEGAEQNWGLLPGTFLFHGHAHFFPGEWGTTDWNMAGSVDTVAFGSDVLGPDDGVYGTVVSAGEPVVFSLEEYAGIVYPCTPPGFLLNPVFSFDPRRTFYSGSYQAHIKTLTTVREKLISEVSPNYVVEGSNLEGGFDYLDAQKMRGWQYFVRTGFNNQKDWRVGEDKDFDVGVGDPIRNPVGDGLNGPSSATAQILGNNLWEVRVRTEVAGAPTEDLETAMANGWGCFGGWISFYHPDSNDNYPDGSPKPERVFFGKIISAVSDVDDPEQGTVIIGQLHALPADDHLSHDHLSLYGSGGWPIQASSQNAAYSKGGNTGGSRFRNTGGGGGGLDEWWYVTKIVKAPIVTGEFDLGLFGSYSLPFIPDHGLNAAYHNHFSSNPQLRGAFTLNPADAMLAENSVHAGTGHIIHENPLRPFTLSLPNWGDFETSLRVRTSSANVTLARLDSNKAVYDDLTDEVVSDEWANARIGWYENRPAIRKMEIDQEIIGFATHQLEIQDYSLGDRSVESFSLEETGLDLGTGLLYSIPGFISASIGFGSRNIQSVPAWYNDAGDGNQYDPDGFVLESSHANQTGTSPTTGGRRDVVLDSKYSQWSEDNFYGTPSFKQAVYNTRSTPQESQDRSIFGALEATVLGNYSFDAVNKATTSIFGDDHVEIGEALMSTEHQFGALSNGVIAGGYCWAYINEQSYASDENIPAHLMQLRSGYSTFTDWALAEGDVALRTVLFSDAYVHVGGTKWHVPSQMIDLIDWTAGSSYSGSEFFIFFDARARRLLCKKKPNNWDIQGMVSVDGVDAPWSAPEQWYYGLLEEAHIIPFAKVITSGDNITQVINLRKPIARLDDRTHILVGVCNNMEEAGRGSTTGSTLGFGQMKVDGYQSAQMHFRNIGEALAYIKEMSVIPSHQGRKWTIEVVGTCYEGSSFDRGIFLPLRLPTHGIKIIGYKSTNEKYLATPQGFIPDSGALADRWIASEDAVNQTTHNSYDVFMSEWGPYRIWLGNQLDAGMVIWDESSPLFDLNSRQGVTVKDLSLEYRGVELDEDTVPGMYWSSDWSLKQNCKPHIAAFICTRQNNDPTVPCLDGDRGNAPYSGIYGQPNAANAAFSGNYLFEGVTLNFGGILVDFYDYDNGDNDENVTKASLDNIVLRNCRAINVTHGLAAFGCHQNVNETDGHWGDLLDGGYEGFNFLGALAGAWKKYHKNILIEGCEAVCTPTNTGDHGGTNIPPRHSLFKTLQAATSKRRAGVFATHTKEITIRDCSFSGSFAYGIYLGEDVSWFDKGWSEEEQHWCTGTVQNNVINGVLEVGVYASSKHAYSDINIIGNTIRECGWPYYDPDHSDAAGLRAVEDPWAIFADAAGVQISDNNIRSIVYANENFGADSGADLDHSHENFCGGIYVANPMAEWFTTRGPKVTGNKIELIGRALKAIVLPDRTSEMFSTTATSAALIANNSINNQITKAYSWEYDQYELNWVGGEDNVIDAASAQFNSLGMNYPFALYVGQGHWNMRVHGNAFVGPVIFSGYNGGLLFTNNSLRDPQSQVWLGSAAVLTESDDTGVFTNASLLAVYDAQRVTISNNNIDRGHIHLDEVILSSITNNNLYPDTGTSIAQYCPQPIGIFLRSGCHQNQINENMIPGNGYVFVGSTGMCYDVSIVANKWGPRAYPVLTFGGDPFTEPVYSNWEPYLPDLTLTDISGDLLDLGNESLHHGGLFYWQGSGGQISNNVLLDNDIMVGNRNFSAVDSFDGIYFEHYLDNPGYEGTLSGNHYAGAGHLIQGNKLNGGSIHVFSHSTTVSNNDLVRYNAEYNNRALPQKILCLLANYSPNIEISGKNTVITGNTVPGDIYGYECSSGTVSGNRVAGNIIMYKSPAVVINNNNLSMTEPCQPDSEKLWIEGEIDFDGGSYHAIQCGNIIIQDCPMAKISDNQSVMGMEDQDQKANIYLLGVPTDPDNHLSYADFYAPFTGRVGLDALADIISIIEGTNHNGYSEEWDAWFAANLPDIADFDSSMVTSFGLYIAVLLAGGQNICDEWGVVDAWYELFGSDLSLDHTDWMYMSQNDFEQLMNAREADSLTSDRRIGGCSKLNWGMQPEPDTSDCPSGASIQYYWRNNLGYGLQDPTSSGRGMIGPYYPLNYQAHYGYDHNVKSYLSARARDYQNWGRRILAVNSRQVEITSNRMSHVELDNCRNSRIDGNRLHWGGFNPGYVPENHSVLVSGNVGTISVTNNVCSGSIWIRDNYNWGYEDDQNNTYTWGSIHYSAEVSHNRVGNPEDTGFRGSAYKGPVPTDIKLFGGESVVWDSATRKAANGGANANRYSNKFFYGGGGCIVIDNCTRLTAIGNTCDSYFGAYPDRWHDQILDGGEWGEIYVNRLGNPYYVGAGDSEGSSGSDSGQWHTQNFQTVITNNKAGGVMGWVRQPTNTLFTPGVWNKVNRESYKVYAPHIYVGDPEEGTSDVTDIYQLMDFVIPCIGASFGEWTGNRVEADAWAYISNPGPPSSNQISALWTCAGSYLGDQPWWGNMDSWTGPAQANGVMTENAVPTCTGSKWFGNPAYYLAKRSLDAAFETALTSFGPGLNV